MDFLGVLGLIFITLKLIGVISWSWWLVLLPIYGGFALLAILIFIFCIVFGLDTSIGKLKKVFHVHKNS